MCVQSQHVVSLHFKRSNSVECAACGKSKSQNTGFPFYQFIKQDKHIHGNRYTLNSNTFTTRSENPSFWSAYSEQCSSIQTFAKQTYGDQYKLIHSLLEAGTGTSVLECILRAMFVISKVSVNCGPNLE